ncbi:MAG TPA: type II secretion system protein, partial [Patescibacteria group bacterium]|nr:type II secretion system protein [Patescibacteria group bacterium]
MKQESGLSLLEILVVVSIFAFLGILITRSIILTVAGSRKSESLVKVRESLNYSLSVIERQLRNANSIPNCPNLDSTYLAYNDQNGNPTSFSCASSAAG